MIKYKLLKYFFIFIGFLTFLVALFLIRISLKPFDLEYISKYVDPNILNEILPIKNFEKAVIHLNIIENEVNIDLQNLKKFKVDPNIVGLNLVISSVNNINIGVSATNLIKKKIKLKKVTINEAVIEVSIENEIYNTYDLKIRNLDLIKKDNAIIGNISKVSINNNSSNIAILNLLQEMNYSSNKLNFSDSKFQIDLDKTFSIKTHFDSENEKIPLDISGNISEDYLLNANIGLEFKKFKIPVSFIKTKNIFNLRLANTDNFIVKGKASIKIFQNRFLASSFDVNFENNSSKKLNILHNENIFSIQMKNVYLKANITENQIEIENCIISTTEENFNVKGIINDFDKNVDANLEVSFKELDLLQLSNPLIRKLNKSIDNRYKVTELISGKLKDIDLNIIYKKNNLIIKDLKGKL
ncbi:MAG: hypothetical protein VXW97_00610, partial [Pseudomonadota bacterium]|nr:hypothetical protein [Pseudomonadota bacterium]